MKIGILTSLNKSYHHFETVCKELKIDYELINLASSNWLDNIRNSDCDGFICRPSSTYQERKSMWDEKLYVINKLMGRHIYPSYEELFIYENKKMMSYWLKLNNFPHADTFVFYSKKEYKDFIKKTRFPMVFKTSIGASAKGVQIVKSRGQAAAIGRKAFGPMGAKMSLGYTPQKTGKVVKLPSFGTSQRHFVILQKHINVKWEWRMIRIGESYFGHKKLLKGDFASGSGKVGWGAPPEELLYMLKDVCDTGNFKSMAMDVFETENGEFYINELQSIFGSVNNSQMFVEGKPGRYLFDDNKFKFEEGEFNHHGSNVLRIKHFLQILEGEKK